MGLASFPVLPTPALDHPSFLSKAGVGRTGKGRIRIHSFKSQGGELASNPGLPRRFFFFCSCSENKKICVEDLGSRLVVSPSDIGNDQSPVTASVWELCSELHAVTQQQLMKSKAALDEPSNNPSMR